MSQGSPFLSYICNGLNLKLQLVLHLDCRRTALACRPVFFSSNLSFSHTHWFYNFGLRLMNAVTTITV